MAKKNEKALTDVELGLLHAVTEHVVSKGLSQFSVALVELNDLYNNTGDERAKELFELVYAASKVINDGLKPILETIPGVKMPTLEELQAMVVEAQAEQEFISLIKSKEPVLH